MVLSKSKFSGYVLAGGKSSRMKTDKALLEMNGETFLVLAVKALENVCQNRVKVVLNRRQTSFVEKLPPEIPRLFDVFEDRGALGGIHAALNDCRTDLAIVLACDMPLVSGEAISILASIALDADEFSAVIPRQSDGRSQPLCAVYRVEKCLPQLEKYLSEESSSAVRDFISLIDAKFIEAKVLDGGKNLLFNVNRPAEYDVLNEM